MPNRSKVLQDIMREVLKGNTDEVLHMLDTGLKLSMSFEEILIEALMPACKKLADKFTGTDFYIPDVLFAMSTIKEALFFLNERMPKKTVYIGRVVIGSVAGDVHDIGKNLIKFLLETSGFEVIDLGVDVPKQEFVAAIKNYQPDILALSASLTTTMCELAKIIEILEQNNLRSMVKIIVGGGPVTREFANFIGADSYSPDAIDSMKVFKKLLS